jgi:hypothetical protein
MITGARYEITVDGQPRSNRDDKTVAIKAAEYQAGEIVGRIYHMKADRELWRWPSCRRARLRRASGARTAIGRAAARGPVRRRPERDMAG